jgi:Ca2+-binding EF-hand superfamily protein
MGNIASCTLSDEEVSAFQSSTVFSANEIKSLWIHFRGIVGEEEEYISRDKFQAVMLFRDTAMLDRIFRVFDEDEDQRISFPEYLKCLNVISSKASEADKLKLSFQMYDFDGDDKISVSDLTSALAATLREHDVIIERTEIDEIVRDTMDEVCPEVPGMISLSEYEMLVAQRPQMLSRLSLNVTGIINDFNVIAPKTVV